jgi:hypothetical protein
MSTKTNIKEFEKEIESIANKINFGVKKGLIQTIHYISNRIVGHYMVGNAVSGNYQNKLKQIRTQPTHSTKLTHRTFRLGRSYQQQLNFNFSGAPGGGASSGKFEGIRELMDTPFGVRLVYGTEVFYGKIHEYGSSKHPPRPHLIPAVNDAKKKNLFIKNIKDEIGI